MRRATRVVLGALPTLAVFVGGCVVHVETPDRLPADARGGHAPPGFDAQRACGSWREAGGGAANADSHVSFPELAPASSCFVAVRYDGDEPRADPTPEGCGYPPRPAPLAVLEASAARYEAIAKHEAAPLPFDLACELPPGVRDAAARTNAKTLRALAVRFRSGAQPSPYAAVATFGYGKHAQGSSTLLAWRPGDACLPIDADETDRLDVNVARAALAAKAFHRGVAPVVTVSGGAVHATLVEAFALMHLLVCQHHVPPDAVLVDPCADHTHTNLRNTGGLVVALGGRTAYVVTEGLQAGYLEDRTGFDLIGGSIDQRSLRDFGYLLGSHRRASVGPRVGFWYTPYRFWAEPERGLGSFTCVAR